MSGTRYRDEFALFLESLGFVAEVPGLVPGRRYRVDYFHPEHKVAVEYDGILSRGASHSSIRGIMRDQEKSNLLQLNGVRVVLRVNAATIADGRAHDWVEAALGLPGAVEGSGRWRCT